MEGISEASELGERGCLRGPMENAGGGKPNAKQARGLAWMAWHLSGRGYFVVISSLFYCLFRVSSLKTRLFECFTRSRN